MAAVLVHIDLDGAKPHPSSIVALAAGRQVASSWGATLYAALIVHDPSASAGPDATPHACNASNVAGLDTIEQLLSRAGADKLVVAMTDTPVAPLWGLVGNAWQGVIDHLRPRLVLFGADTPSAAELAPRTGARIGARLLLRARTSGGDEIELRDRDGALVRIGDSGAAVALVGRAEARASHPPHDDDIDLVLLALPRSSDGTLELAGTQPAELATMMAPLVALGDDVLGDAKVVAGARRIAEQLGATLVGSAAAAKLVAPGALVDRTTPLAPELCVTVGNVALDLAGATSVVRIGGSPDKTADGTLPAPADVSIASLAKHLEDA